MANLENNVSIPEGFKQVCVWEGCLILNGENPTTTDYFESWFQTEFGIRAKYLEEITTNPTPGVRMSGGRNDALFAIEDGDLGTFAIKRLNYGIRWVEDVVKYNDSKGIYPDRVVEYCNW